jgi:hypothetical protein
MARAPFFRARFFAFLPFFEMVSSASDGALLVLWRSKTFWKTRIYHSGRRDVIMNGMTFHDGSRASSMKGKGYDGRSAQA